MALHEDMRVELSGREAGSKSLIACSCENELARLALRSQELCRGRERLSETVLDRDSEVTSRGLDGKFGARQP